MVTHLFSIGDNKTMSYERFTALVKLMERYPSATMIHHDTDSDVVYNDEAWNVDNEGNIETYYEVEQLLMNTVKMTNKHGNIFMYNLY